MVQGTGAGLDKMGQAKTKPIIILKTESKDTKNGNIHAKIVIPKAEYEDAKDLVKEDNAERNKEKGAGRGEMNEGEGAGLDEMVQAETKPIVILKSESEDTRNGNSHTKLIKDNEEANKIVSGCKRLIIKDREGKKKNNKRSKTEPRRVARDRYKVQEMVSRLAETRRQGEKQEEFGNLDGDYYLLAGPRLVEAHDYSTSVPHTGAERSTPRPLTVSNLLYSQHQGDNQHKDGGCKPHDKIRLAKIATGQATPARDNYLPADPRLAEAHNYSTVVPCTGADRSGQQTITGTNSTTPAPEQRGQRHKRGQGRDQADHHPQGQWHHPCQAQEEGQGGYCQDEQGQGRGTG